MFPQFSLFCSLFSCPSPYLSHLGSFPFGFLVSRLTGIPIYSFHLSAKGNTVGRAPGPSPPAAQWLSPQHQRRQPWAAQDTRLQTAHSLAVVQSALLSIILEAISLCPNETSDAPHCRSACTTLRPLSARTGTLCSVSSCISCNVT